MGQLAENRKRLVVGIGMLAAACMPLAGHATTQCASAELENTAMTATTPTSEFILHDDGTATHVRTGLMWKRCSQGQTWNAVEESCSTELDTELNWFDAHQHVESVNDAGGFAGYTDWRLPTLNEFESIAELRCFEPAANTRVFPNLYFGVNQVYWTASPYARDPSGTSNGWAMQFEDGGLNFVGLLFSFRVHMVRDADMSEEPM